MTAIVGDAAVILSLASEIEAPRAFTPVEDRVVLKPIDAGGEQIRNGVVIPEVARERPQEAEIVALGPTACATQAMAVGQRVLYGKYSGVEITVDGTDYIIMRASDLLLVFA